MYRQKYVLSYGEHAQTTSLPVTIFTNGPFGLRGREREQSIVEQIQHKISLFQANSTLLPLHSPSFTPPSKQAIKVDPRCELCCQQAETVSHLLWECPFARNVWAMFKGQTQKCNNEANDFFLLFKQMQIKLSQLELERRSVTTWSIWNARNTFYFEQMQTHPRVILEGAGALFEEYQRLMVAHQAS